MKSVNKVILLGNLTHDPELRYTENKKAVCAFGWQLTELGQLRPGRSGKKQSFTGLLPGRS
jgi:single-stranded DNA-binding protein